MYLHASSGVSLGLQRVTKLFQKKLHILLGSQRAHYANAENFAGKRTEPSSDFYARFVQQAFSHFSLVNSFWNAHRVQGRNSVTFRNVQIQAHRFDALDKRTMATAMSLPTLLDIFVRDHQQSLAQSVEHGNRRGVMVAMRDGRVVVDQLEVKIPTAYWSTALAQEPHSSRRHGHGRQAGWTTQPFLGATVSDVDTRLVKIDLHSAERSHAVCNHQRADIVSGGTDHLARLQRSRRCLCVNISDNFGLFTTDKLRCFLIRESCAPGFLKAYNMRSLPLGHLR